MHLNRAELLTHLDKKPAYKFSNGNFSNLYLRFYHGIPVGVREYDKGILHEAKIILDLPPHACLPVLIGVCAEIKPYLLVTKFYGKIQEGVFISISGALTSTKIDISTWLLIVLDIAEGLNHMHSNGVIHGELNGKNIILQKKFGIHHFQPLFLNLGEARCETTEDILSYQNDIIRFRGLVDTITKVYNHVSPNKSMDALLALCVFIKDIAPNGRIDQIIKHFKTALYHLR